MTEYILTLRSFLEGKTNIASLEDAIASRLDALRSTPTQPTEEQRALSQIELMIEEVREGTREVIDVYIATSLALQSVDLSVFNKPADQQLIVQPWPMGSGSGNDLYTLASTGIIDSQSPIYA